MEAVSGGCVDQELESLTTEQSSMLLKSDDVDLFELGHSELLTLDPLPENNFTDENEVLFSCLRTVDDNADSIASVLLAGIDNEPLVDEKSCLDDPGDTIDTASKADKAESTSNPLLSVEELISENRPAVHQGESSEDLKSEAKNDEGCIPLELALSEFQVDMDVDELFSSVDLSSSLLNETCSMGLDSDDKIEKSSYLEMSVDGVPTAVPDESSKAIPDDVIVVSDSVNIALENPHVVSGDGALPLAPGTISVIVDNLTQTSDDVNSSSVFKTDQGSSTVDSNDLKTATSHKKGISECEGSKDDTDTRALPALIPSPVIRAAFEVNSLDESLALESALSSETVKVNSKPILLPKDLTLDANMSRNQAPVQKASVVSEVSSYSAVGCRHRLPQTISYNKPSQVLDLTPVSPGGRQMQILPPAVSRPHMQHALGNSSSSSMSRSYDVHFGRGDNSNDPHNQPPLNLSVDCGAINLKSSPVNTSMLSTDSTAVSGKESTAMNLKMPSLLKIRDIQPPQHTMSHMTSRQNLLPRVKQTRGSKPTIAGGGILVRKNEIPVNRLAPGAYVGSIYGESQDYSKPVLVPGKSHHLKHMESQQHQQQLQLKHPHGMKTTNFGPVIKVSSGHSRHFGVQPIAIKQVTSSAVGAHHSSDAVLSLRRGMVAHRLPSSASLGLSVGRGMFSGGGLAKDNNKMSLLISPTASSPRTQPAPVRSVPYGLQSPISSSSVSISSSSHSTDRLVIKPLRPSSVVRSSPFEYGSAYDAFPMSLVTSSEHQQTALNSSCDGPMDMSRSSKKLIGGDQPTDMSRSLKSELNERSDIKFHSTLRLQTHGGVSGGEARGGWQDLDLSSVSDWKNDNVRIESRKDGRSSISAEPLSTKVQVSPSVQNIDKKESNADAANGIKTTMDLNENSHCACLNCGKFCDAMLEGSYCSSVCKEQCAKKKATASRLGRPSIDGGEEKKSKRKSTTDEDGAKSSKHFCPSGYRDGDIRKSLKSKFSWNHYLQQERATAAPAHVFKCPFPVVKMGFKVGMKLEGIDPQHPSLYCVLTVAEIRGFRLRLHFDEYSECFDFWTNADSPFIFPAGWVEKNGKVLQPPLGYTNETFEWNNYLKMTSSQAAPKILFSSLPTMSVTPSSFRIGMKLEAIDKKSTSQTCVATVSDVLGDRVLIHFDGWEDIYDYWCELSSPYIHPVGWCQEMGKPLSPPNDCADVAGFTWEEYLSSTKSQSVPARAFKPHPAHGFEVDMKLEVVDKRNPILVRVATIAEVEPWRLKIHFDGWSDAYDYWVDDDCADLHPAGWCYKTGHHLTPPLSPAELVYPPAQGNCPTPGCSGIGHIKGAKYTGHHSAFGCPYSTLNMNKEWALHDRLQRLEAEPNSALKSSKNITSALTIEQKKCPTPGCDGSGHITGKYTAHYRLSGCPLAEKNRPMKISPQEFGKEAAKDETSTEDGLNSEVPNIMEAQAEVLPVERERPLFGPGSGRGRKKKKILRLIQEQQKKLQANRNSIPSVGSSNVLYSSIHQSVFMPSTPTVAPKDLPMTLDQQSKLLPGVEQYKANVISEWSVTQVADFINSLPGCTDLSKAFMEEQIDGEAFLLLTQADIVKVMNIKLGPAIKIYNSILMIKNNMDV